MPVLLGARELDPEAREKIKKSSRLFESINKIISSYSPKSAEFVVEERFTKSARNTLLVLAVLGTLGSAGCSYIRETYPRDVLSAESISQLDDGGGGHAGRPRRRRVRHPGRRQPEHRRYGTPGRRLRSGRQPGRFPRLLS